MIPIQSPEFIQLYNQDQRIDITYPDVRREVDGAVIRHINRSAAGEGFVVYSQLDEHNADAEIQRQIEFFRAIGQNFEWKLYSFDPPADMYERLAANHFTIGEEEHILVLDLAGAPPKLFEPPRYTIEKITTPAELTDVFAVERQVWHNEHASVSEYLRVALTDYPQQMSIYVGYVDGVPAGSGWVYFPENSRFASLWGGSTVAAFRRRGVYTALLSVRAQEARARGESYLTVDASPMSRPILEKFGFQSIGSTWSCMMNF